MSKIVDRILNGEEIKSVLTEGSIIKESKEKDIVDANNMVADWLKDNTYGYDIISRETQHKIIFKEYGPDGSSDESYFIIRSDGKLYNENGDDVVAIALDAYDNDPDAIAKIKKFKNKWYN